MLFIAILKTYVKTECNRNIIAILIIMKERLFIFILISVHARKTDSKHP
jgi:hypothetical protein